MPIMKNLSSNFKRISVIIFFGILFCLFVLLLTGCTGNDSKNSTQTEPSIEQSSYTVKIKVNNSDYGEIINENLKTKYNYGETINFRVLLNPGYILDKYSDDPNTRSLERSIVVTEDIEIIAYLAEGCEFTFYGYPVASFLDTKNLANVSNSSGLGYSYYITQNQKVNTGYLRFYVEDKDDFSFFLLEQSGKKILLAKDPNENFIYGEESFDEFFDNNKDELIKIKEYDTFIGYAYAQYKDSADESKNPYDDIELGVFEENKIDCTLNYLYIIDNVKHIKGFIETSDNHFITTHIAENNDSVAFSILRLFLFEDQIYFYHQANDHYFVNYSASFSDSWSINNIEYSIIFNSLKP